ncbi:hypothetical protein [Streptomyces sp. NPDC004008]
MESLTGWRVHFTRREQAWHREATALTRAISALFADLDQRSDEWCVTEGRPVGHVGGPASGA